MLVIIDQRRDMAVFGLIWFAIGRSRAMVVCGTKRRGKHGAIGMFDQHEARHRLEHADFDLLPLAGARAVE